MCRRTVCGIALAALMFATLGQSISYAEPNSQSPVSQASVDFDDQFLPPFKNVHGEATDSIGIDYTPEARCSDDNWSSPTPVACNPQLSFMCTGNNPLSTCPSSCQKCYNDDLANLRDSLGVSTITSYQPNYYILTTAQNLKMRVLQGDRKS